MRYERNKGIVVIHQTIIKLISFGVSIQLWDKGTSVEHTRGAESIWNAYLVLPGVVQLPFQIGQSTSVAFHIIVDVRIQSPHFRYSTL